MSAAQREACPHACAKVGRAVPARRGPPHTADEEPVSREEAAGGRGIAGAQVEDVRGADDVTAAADDVTAAAAGGQSETGLRWSALARLRPAVHNECAENKERKK
jgi:hypothetical protein